MWSQFEISIRELSLLVLYGCRFWCIIHKILQIDRKVYYVSIARNTHSTISSQMYFYIADDEHADGLRYQLWEKSR